MLVLWCLSHWCIIGISQLYVDCVNGQAEFLGTLLLQFLASLSGTSLGYGLSYTVMRKLYMPFSTVAKRGVILPWMVLVYLPPETFHSSASVLFSLLLSRTYPR